MNEKYWHGCALNRECEFSSPRLLCTLYPSHGIDNALLPGISGRSASGYNIASYNPAFLRKETAAF